MKSSIIKRSSLDRSGLGYGPNNNGKNSRSIAPIHEAGTHISVDVLMSLFKEKGNRKINQQYAHVNKGATQSRRPFIVRYQTIFLGNFYFCHNFGHKDANCKALENINFERNITPLKSVKDDNLNR